MFILKNQSDILEKDKGFDVIACWRNRLDSGPWTLDSGLRLKKNYQKKNQKNYNQKKKERKKSWCLKVYKAKLLPPYKTFT